MPIDQFSQAVIVHGAVGQHGGHKGGDAAGNGLKSFRHGMCLKRQTSILTTAKANLMTKYRDLRGGNDPLDKFGGLIGIAVFVGDDVHLRASL